jgi:hypothetical protein
LGDEIGSANNVTGRNNRATLCDTKCSRPRVPGREILDSEPPRGSEVNWAITIAARHMDSS